MMYPEGSLVQFLGDEWLGTLKGEIGIVVEHDSYDCYEESMKVLVIGKTINIIYDEFKDSELALVQ
jgi:hypothetical protein